MGEVFAGRYELVDVLGHGGMGDVWRVWDHRDSTYRAAKLLRQVDSVSLLRFVRESSWRIEHPHVVMPTGWAGEDDRVLFTMPIIAGGSVATVLADHGSVPWSWAEPVLRQVLAALEAVHAAGLVHRDLKPANVLLEPSGNGRPHAYLSDFGIAVHRDEPRLTRASETIGTRGYQSPEAAAGADPVPAHDLYAFGVLAERMVGELPTGSVLDRLIDPDPTLRPGSIAEILDGLADVELVGSDDESVTVFDQVPPLPPEWGPEGPNRRPVAATVADPAPRRRRIAGDVWLAIGLAGVGIALLVGAVLAI